MGIAAIAENGRIEDWATAAVVSAVALACYLATLAPTVTLESSGQFSVVTLLGVNPYVDIQTTFIVRVYFIRSFAVLAIRLALSGLFAATNGVARAPR